MSEEKKTVTKEERAAALIEFEETIDEIAKENAEVAERSAKKLAKAIKKATGSGVSEYVVSSVLVKHAEAAAAAQSEAVGKCLDD